MASLVLSALAPNGTAVGTVGAVVLLLMGTQLLWVRRGSRAVSARECALAHATAAAALHRRRIARRLRNETIQSMAGVGYALESLGPALPTTQQPLVTRAASAVREDLGRLQALVSDLEDDVAACSTLAAALDPVVDDLRRSGVEVELDLSRVPALRTGTAELVHHLVTELTSAAPATPPRDVSIAAGRRAGRLCVTVDIGGALRPDRIDAVREAVVRAGGSLDGAHAAERTRVDVELPVR